ncbi:MAG: YdcF family protein [Clostridia bacterium]|nr:YdcF family protein [Clostridia bacterium]
MNIKDIDLLQLSEKLINKEAVSNDEVDILNRIFFSCISNSIPKSDVIIVLGGSACNDRIAKGVEAMKESGAKYIMPTGGVSHAPGTPTEAMRMHDYCIEQGISPESIIVENQATTTRENIIFCSILISRLNIVAPKVVIVSSASHIRRVQMCCNKIENIFPNGSQIFYVSSAHEDCKPDNWHTNDYGKYVIGRELQLLHRYLYKYDCEAFEI